MRGAGDSTRCFHLSPLPVLVLEGKPDASEAVVDVEPETAPSAERSETADVVDDAVWKRRCRGVDRDSPLGQCGFDLGGGQALRLSFRFHDYEIEPEVVAVID